VTIPLPTTVELGTVSDVAVAEVTEAFEEIAEGVVVSVSTSPE
jgi:hypothetical protein